MERRISASRRIANVLLSVVLVLGLTPAPAFAGETGIANDTAGPAVTATQGAQLDESTAAASLDSQADSPAAQQDAAVIDADDSNGGESLSEAGDISASMESDTTAGVLDIDAAPMSDGASALSEGGASLTPGWTRSGTCEWKIDATGLLTVRPLGDGASGVLADWWSSYYNLAPWYYQRESIKSAVIEPGVSAKTCYAMFYGCSSLATLNLSSFGTSAVTDMDCMFYGCSSLASLDLSGLDASKVTDMGVMFGGCSSLATLDLSGLDTSAATDMGSMFYGCKSLSSLDLSLLDTSAVTDMGSMFYGCKSLSSLDLSLLDTSAVTDMGSMFYGCSSLKTIYASPGFDTGAVQRSGYMFRGCSALVGGNGTAYSPDYTDKYRARVDGCDGPGYLTLTPGWIPSGTCEWMIDDAGLLTVRPLGDGVSGELADWDSYDGAPWYSQRDFIKSAVIEPGVSARTCKGMFEGCSSLSSLDLSLLDTSAVTDMGSMFYGCKSLSSLDLSGLDTSQVTSMSQMFRGCSSLTTLDLSSFDFGKVADFNAFAPYGPSVTARDAESYRILANEASMRNITVKDVAPSDETWSVWNTCEWKVANGTLVIRPAGGATSGMLGYPFQQIRKPANDGYVYYYAPWCQQVEDIKSVAIEPGIVACDSVANLFSNHTNLASVNLSGLDFSTVKNMSKMFYGCASLEEIPAGFEMPANVPVSQCFYVPDPTEMRYAGADAAITTYDWASDNRVLAPAAAEGWSRFGGVQWRVANGTLTIAPLPGEGGGEIGSLGVYAGAPWYAQRKDIASVKIEGDIKAGASLGYAFDGMANLVSADLSNLDVSATNDMSCMFRGCSSLASVNLSDWDTQSLEKAYMAFSKCASLQSVNLIGWDFSHVTDMRQMFAYCPELAEVPSGLTIPAGVDSSKLFYVDQKAPIDYNGSDKSLMAYDWMSDNRIAAWVCAGEHTWGEGVATKKPTCTEPGEETLTCTVCGATLVGSPVAPRGHRFDGMVCTDCGTHLGDVNGNGVVNVVDAQVAYDIATILGMYADLHGYKAYHGAADVTGSGGTPDGIVDAVDAFRIQYAALHGWE